MADKVTETERDRATTRVMRAVARRSIVLGPLPVRASDGTYPVIVTLPDDTLDYMETRRDSIGRDSNVVVAFPERMVLIAMRDGQSDDAAPIHRDQMMAMFVYWLQNTDMNRPAIRVADKEPGESSSRPRTEDLAYIF